MAIFFQIVQLTAATFPNSTASYLLGKFRTFWIILTSVALCISKNWLDYTSSVVGIFFMLQWDFADCWSRWYI